VRDQQELLKKAGFTTVEHIGMTTVATSPYTAGALFKAF
jgi:hypothetical protein